MTFSSPVAARAYDAVVIGGGHNGLVCAAVLGATGRKVVVLEAAPVLGGAARSWEFAPGFRAPGLAHLVNRMHGAVVRALDLKRHGLSVSPGALLPTTVLAEGGTPVTLRGAYGETLSGVGEAEARSWRALRGQLLRHAGVLKPFLFRAPPDMRGPARSDLLGLAGSALAMKRLGADEMRDFLRMLLTNVADVADEHFTDDRLKGLLAFDATLGAHLGPRSPTSLLGLYYRLAGDVDGIDAAQVVPEGGIAQLASTLAAAAVANGVELRCGAPVASIALGEQGRAASVTLASGETLRARSVVSAVNPATTFLDLLGPRSLDAGFVRRLRSVRCSGNVARLHLALDRMPDIPGVDASDAAGRLVIAPSSDHVERAFNPAKYGAFSPEPVMEITFPHLAEPGLAPSGAAVLSALVQFAPYRLREGWTAGKPKFEAAILAQLERHAPGLGGLVRHAELLTPEDIEARFSIPGGHWHHGELQADQMLVSRPLFGAERYDTPVPGLFLCGAGSHPGGGLSGAPGLNAARRIIELRQ